MRRTFKIPDLPQSVNSLYKINYGHRVVYLSQEGRAFKFKVKLYMPALKFPKDSKFSISMQFHSNWKYKNGNNKRADIQNLIKILIDAIFEKLGVDDSYVYHLEALKIQSKAHFTLVTLKDIADVVSA